MKSAHEIETVKVARAMAVELDDGLKMVRSNLEIVRNLTLRRTRRHEIDAFASCRTWLLAIIACLPGLALAAEGAWHSSTEIAAVAENFLQQRIGKAADRTSARASTLDPRLRLARCEQPLEAFLRNGTRISARTVVGVRCTGAKPWKLYVPVDVVVTENVLIARRTLPRGHVLSAADFTVEPRDVARLVSGYISDADALVGQKLKIQLIAGRMLTPSMLEADAAVRRGQSVTIVASGGGISVRMTGKALMDGAINQRIRVENLNSGRVVEGIVRSREHVEVLLPAATSFFQATPKVSPSMADMRHSNNDR